MGRWYDALKKSENSQSRNPQNPQNRTQVSFGGFGGSPPERIEKSRGEVLGVLGVPSQSVSENSRVASEEAGGGFVSFVSAPSERIENFFAISLPAAWDAEDWQMAFEERAAILEYDGGFTRSEAERLARIEIEALRKTSGI